MASTGRARFYEVAGDGRVLAIEYCFVLGDRCYWRLPGRDPDPELEKLRLGRVSLTEMFRMLIETGHTMVEGGPGHYDYKLRLGAEEYSLRRIVIGGRSRCRVGARLFGALGRSPAARLLPRLVPQGPSPARTTAAALEAALDSDPDLIRISSTCASK